MLCEIESTIETVVSEVPTDSLRVESNGQSYFAPRTSDELAAFLIAHPEATILAGGTDVGVWVTKRRRNLDRIVFIGNVEDLKRVEETERGLEIPAAATYADVHERIRGHYADFGELIRRIGSIQIRNLGTVCGNVANGSPVGDMPPALIALGATLVLRKGDERREMPLETFFVEYGIQDIKPGEFVERVILPVRTDVTFRAYKISKRFDQDISAVCGAFAFELDDSSRIRDIRICYGGMAGVPKRADRTEAALRGGAWDRGTVKAAMLAMENDFTPLSDMRASAAYRMRVAQNLLLKCFLETKPPATPIRIAGAWRAEP